MAWGHFICASCRCAGKRPWPCGARRTNEGTTGVTARIVSVVTVTRGTGGFVRIMGLFDRRGLISYAEPIPGDLMLRRVDAGRTVHVSFESSRVPGAPEMPVLLERLVRGTGLTAGECAGIKQLLAGETTFRCGEHARGVWQTVDGAIVVSSPTANGIRSSSGYLEGTRLSACTPSSEMRRVVGRPEL